MFQTIVVEKIKTYILCPVTVFFIESRAVHDTVEADRPEMIVWRMHFACWISKATNTH
jgi:hypothetical protein